MPATKTKAKKKSKKETFDPKILVFACNWCSYAGADNAGVNRLQYAPNIRVIRVMCSGRVNSAFVLEAFRMGADGVLWSGCHFGDCHYIFGNYRAEENYKILQSVLDIMGIEKKRLRLEWVSAAEGVRWAQLINEFTDEIKDLGSNKFHAGA